MSFPDNDVHDDDVVVRRQLHSIAGIDPSHYWYRACVNELQLQERIDFTSGDTNRLATAVLDQILHSDLYNVVRTIADDDINNNNNQLHQQNEETSSRILRDAIRQSMDVETGYKCVLPQSFRLLVQINEFVDVASSLEKRMEAINDTNQLSPTQVCSPPASRCLKFCYTDGYTNTNANRTNNENRPRTHVGTTNTFVAMEVSSLDGLGTQYQLVAGLKILLHGPIIIRHGVAGWHSGCATILGGSVNNLVEMQRRALIHAKKESGSGVDPTVKALVRNNPLMAIENDIDDEGEHESRDISVTNSNRNLPIQQQQQHPNQYDQASTTNFPRQQQQQQSFPVVENLPQRQQIQSQAHEKRRNANQQLYSNVQASFASEGFVVGNSNNTSIVATQPIQPSTIDLASTTPSSSTIQSMTASSNPYRRSDTASNNNTRIISQPSHKDESRQQNQAHTNLASSSPLVSAPVLSSITNAATQPTCNPHNLDIIQIATANKQHETTEVAQRMSIVPTPSLTQAATLKVGIGYQQLRDLLVRAVQCESIYQQMYGKVYTVANIVQVGTKLYFNIEKNKKIKQNKKDDSEGKSVKADKYEYVMTARFQQYNHDIGKITCKISSSILEPYFSIPPREMRILNKENRSHAEMMIKDGGLKLSNDLFQPSSYDVTLVTPTDEFFASSTKAISSTLSENESKFMVDDTKPILLLINRISW